MSDRDEITYDLTPGSHYIESKSRIKLGGDENLCGGGRFIYREDITAFVMPNEDLNQYPYYSVVMGADVICVGLARRFGLDVESLLGQNKAMKRFLDTSSGAEKMRCIFGEEMIQRAEYIYYLHCFAPFFELDNGRVHQLFDYMVGMKPGFWLCSTEVIDLDEGVELFTYNLPIEPYIDRFRWEFEDTYSYRGSLIEYLQAAGFTRIEGTEVWWLV